MAICLFAVSNRAAFLILQIAFWPFAVLKTLLINAAAGFRVTLHSQKELEDFPDGSSAFAATLCTQVCVITALRLKVSIFAG